jgi:transcriptional antiterminator NusG
MSTTNLNDEGRQWYVVNTYSGHENKVKENILKRVESMGIQDCLFNIVIPTHVETVLKEEKVMGSDGKKTSVQKKVNVTTNKFPGYVLVEMIMTDEAWYVVRNTSGVTGFIGSSGGGTKPFPIAKHEIEPILKSMGVKTEIEVDFEEGDEVNIFNGPFAGKVGKVEYIDREKETARVLVEMLGGVRPITVDVAHLQKVEY